MPFQRAKTELFGQWQNGNLVVSDEGESTGRRIWVHSGDGTDAGGYGGSPDRPVATLDYAMSLCTANEHDIIYVMPGHSETLTTLITCDIEGVRIVGLGAGDNRPQFTVNANIDGISITADNVTIENLYFNEGTAAHPSNINVAAGFCTLRNIHMDAGTNEIDAITATAAAEKLTVEDCVWIVTADGPDDFVLFEGVVDLPIIRRNHLVGCDGTNAVDDGILNFGGQAITNAVVMDNVFDGADQVTTVMADVASLVGDCVAGNRYAGSATDADTVTTSTAALSDDAITAAKIADNAIDAGAIAAAAIDAATFAADALQAMQDEAEDALEGENLDHVAKTAVANNADMTTEITDGTILSNILTKGSDTSDYDPATDSLEMLSDKAGGFSGDGGANQDDSVKASLDLAHTDLDAILADTGTDGVAIADGYITSAKFGASAIDSTVIAAGAIDAAAIAAGAIDADAIADDAIDAASIATGAFTADAFAANAIVAATLNADCITNAKIADDAIAAENLATGALTADAFAADAIVAATLATGVLTSDAFAASAAEYTCDGVVVTRATAALPQTAAGALFTVTGHVLLKRIIGVVTTAIGNVPNVVHLQLNSTGAGATTDLCLAGGGLDIDNDAADTTYEITGTVGDAMVATTNLPKNPAQLLDILLVPGSLEIETAGSDGGGGRVRWSATYVPMEAGAKMEAA